MIGNFGPCRAWLKQDGIEGGKDDDKRDPGGRTNEGIEQRECDAWCHLRNLPKIDVWDASEDMLTEIYRVQYWSPYCDYLPKGVDLVFFDVHVNQGQRVAVEFLQQALGIEADGHWGLVTAAHVKDIDAGGNYPTSKMVIDSITRQRIHRYRGTRNFDLYGHGWLSRADRCEVLGYTMAAA